MTARRRSRSPRRGADRRARGCRRASCSAPRFRGCAPAGCARRCRRSGSRSGSARWSPSSASRRPARPTCWRRSTPRHQPADRHARARRSSGNNEVLPDTSVPMIGHMQNVQSAAAVYQVANANVLPHAVRALPSRRAGSASTPPATNLPQVVGTTIASGHFLNAVSERYPGGRARGAGRERAADQPASAATSMVYLGNTWFTVVGIMKPVVLDSSLDSTVFISLPVAERLFQEQPNPSEIYVRANQNDVTQVANLLAPTADPQNADGVQRDAGRPMRSRRAPPPRASSPRCCSGSARSRCSSARSGSRTSWSSRCSSVAARSACAARSAPPAGTSASSS